MDSASLNNLKTRLTFFPKFTPFEDQVVGA